MKKQIIAGITVAACVALCAAVWLRSAEVDDIIAVEPEKKTHLGHMAGLRSTTMSYKNKKLIRHP